MIFLGLNLALLLDKIFLVRTDRVTSGVVGVGRGDGDHRRRRHHHHLGRCRHRHNGGSHRLS